MITDVLILGAGLAGLAAARELKRNGMDFRILEARDRIGGRLWKDFGAQVLHSPDQNPLVGLARDLNLKTTVTRYDNYRLYRGPSAVPDNETARLKKDFANLLKKAVSGRQPAGRSVYEAMKRKGLKKAFKENP